MNKTCVSYTQCHLGFARNNDARGHMLPRDANKSWQSLSCTNLVTTTYDRLSGHERHQDCTKVQLLDHVAKLTATPSALISLTTRRSPSRCANDQRLPWSQQSTGLEVLDLKIDDCRLSSANNLRGFGCQGMPRMWRRISSDWRRGRLQL